MKIIPKLIYSLNIKKGKKKIKHFDELTKNAPEINKQLRTIKKVCLFRLMTTTSSILKKC